MRRGVFLLVFALFVGSTYGQIVPLDTAKDIASKFLKEDFPKRNIPSESFSSLPYKASKGDENPELFLFNADNGGFVIVSGDKRGYPILAYSFESSIPDDKGDWPPAFRDWVETMERHIETLRIENALPEDEVSMAWMRMEAEEPFLQNNIVNDGPIPSEVAPLLSTRWNQGCGYNALCPVAAGGPCGRVYTGCVATAMAQVMRYMEYPVSGVGSYCYNTTNYGQLCANFSDGIYNYAAMIDTTGNAHVAKLMYHCGVSVNMNYSPTGSGAYSSGVVNAWKKYFDYKNAVLIYKNSYSESDWISILKKEISSNRPLYYAGYSSSSGHAFVLHGYNSNNQFRVDWGWGGSANGYFYVTAMGNYSSSQQTIVGAIPGNIFSNLDFSSVQTLECATPVSGDIAMGNDYINYYKNTYPVAIGKELVYTFSNNLPGRIRIKISNNLGGDVNVFLLSHPHQDSLIQYGTNGLIVDDMIASTYYLAVEGVNKKEPTFDIEVICPTLDADIVFTSSSVSPEFVEPLLNNVVFNSTLKNIGNTAAGSCSIAYYFSEDMNLDGEDIFIGTDIVPALQPGESTKVTSILTMPEVIPSGRYNVIFCADMENVVLEADDDNFSYASVQVPEIGALDCNAALALVDGEWYLGNTLLSGNTGVDTYWSAADMTGPEVVHTFSSSYNGIAKISFSEKHPGEIKAIVLPLCNENTYLTNSWFNSITDTIVYFDQYVVAGTQYYIVVDGHKGAAGEYKLKVDLPEVCPNVVVDISGKTDMCEGDYYPNMWTAWGMNKYQWYKNGEAIPEAIENWFNPLSPGTYYLEVTENNCAGVSPPIDIKMDVRPDTAHIYIVGDTIFCPGGSAQLLLSNSVNSPVNWALNNIPIDGATSTSYTASLAGTYSLIATNGSCSVNSANTIRVYNKKEPVILGEKLPVPASNVKFFYPFDVDNADMSGNNFSFSCWNFLPENDRFGNFWTARYYTQENVMGYCPNQHTLPNHFTHTLWFKTSTNMGGVITGFFNNPWNASQMESLLYMDNDGRLRFYMSNGSSPAELISTKTYNDGEWHGVTIMYNGNMQLSINNGNEVLQNNNNISKLNFLGYWVFAGPNLPSNIGSMPTSKYFDGSIDDMLCVYESNSNIEKYNIFNPRLGFRVLDFVGNCSDPLVQIEILNSEPNVAYRIWNESLQEWYSAEGIGNFDTLRLTGNYDILTATDLKISARNVNTGCEVVFDTLIYVIPKTKIKKQPVSTILCDTTEHTFLVESQGHNLTYQWKHGSNIIGEDAETLKIIDVGTEDIGEYTVTVTGTCGEEVSLVANLFIGEKWAITTEPHNANYCEGDQATVSVIPVDSTHCFGAIENITIAGNGRIFLAEAGSAVTFIAGSSIRFLPGFKAEHGSYVHGYITDSGDFCEEILQPSIVQVANNPDKGIEFALEEKTEEMQSEKKIKLYPNPNNGRFTLQLSDFENEAIVRVFDMIGRNYYRTVVAGNGDTKILLPQLPEGIYQIMVSDGKTIKTSKMVIRR